MSSQISIHALLAESDRSAGHNGTAPAYFYPRSPCGERLRAICSAVALIVSFLSTLSLRRATPVPPPCGIPDRISIHALLAESDLRVTITVPSLTLFLSTLSLRRATSYTSAECGRIAISIHALLAESDNSANANLRRHRNFYPRSPCGERRPLCRAIGLSAGNFYPRSPCGERRFKFDFILCHSHFYPRSPCGERPRTRRQSAEGLQFLSTLSLRRATAVADVAVQAIAISIHALLAESDGLPRRCCRCLRNFYPRSPCGERRSHTFNLTRFQCYFYPRSPCGERHRPYCFPFQTNNISIHALLAESDLCAFTSLFGAFLFLSTLSLRRATVRVYELVWGVSISIHALLAESDWACRWPDE